MVYGICGEIYSAQEIVNLKAQGFIDFCKVQHADSAPDPAFVTACNNAGVSPLFNNGNDGKAGCSSNCDVYYANVANAGYHAAGGESESASEMSSIMGKLIFLNYGGEYGGCGYNFSDIYAHGAPSSTGFGTASYLETYYGVAGLGMCPNEIVTACVSAKNHGCKEVGILIGCWIAGHPELGYTTAQPYLTMISNIEAAGVTVSGVHLWWGFNGMSMWQNYMANGNNNIIQGIMAQYPPNKTTMKNRFAGVGPTPTPTPTPTPVPVPSDVIWFGEGVVDIYDYLAKKHDGQPTPGIHNVEVLPSATSTKVDIAVRVKEYQAGLE